MTTVAALDTFESVCCNRKRPRVCTLVMVSFVTVVCDDSFLEVVVVVGVVLDAVLVDDGGR